MAASCAQDYWNFRYAHHHVHGTPVAVPGRLRRDDDGTYLINTRGSGASMADGTALFLARFALLALSGMFGTLGLPKPPEIGALLQRVEDLGTK